MEEEDEIDDDMQENDDRDRDAFNDDTFGDDVGIGHDLTFGAAAGVDGDGQLDEDERARKFLAERAAMERERAAALAARAPRPVAPTSYLRVSGVPRLGDGQIELLLGHFGALVSFELHPGPDAHAAGGGASDVVIVAYAEAACEAAATERLHGMLLAGGRLAVERLSAPPPAAHAQPSPMPADSLDVAALEAALAAAAAAPMEGAMDVEALEAALAAQALAPPALAHDDPVSTLRARLQAAPPQPQPQPPPQQPPQQPQKKSAWQQPAAPPASAAAAAAGGSGARAAALSGASVAQLGDAERALATLLRSLAAEAERAAREAAGAQAQLAALPALRGQPGADARALAEAEGALASLLARAAAARHSAQARAVAAQAELSAVQAALRALLGASASAGGTGGAGGGEGARAAPPASVASPYGPGGAPVWASLLPGMPRLPPSARVGVRMTLAELEMIVRHQNGQVAVNDVLADDFYAFALHCKRGHALGTPASAAAAESADAAAALARAQAGGKAGAAAAGGAREAARSTLPAEVLIALDSRRQPLARPFATGLAAAGTAAAAPTTATAAALRARRLVDFSSALGQGIMRVHADPALKLRTPRPLIAVPSAAGADVAGANADADELGDDGLSGRERSAASAASWAVRAAVDAAAAALLDLRLSRLMLAAAGGGGGGGGGAAAPVAHTRAQCVARIAAALLAPAGADAPTPAAGAAAAAAAPAACALERVLCCGKGRRVVAEALGACVAEPRALAAPESAEHRLCAAAGLALLRALPAFAADRRAPAPAPAGLRGAKARAAAAAAAAAASAPAATGWAELAAAVTAATLALPLAPPGAPSGDARAAAAAELATLPAALLAEVVAAGELSMALAALSGAAMAAATAADDATALDGLYRVQVALGLAAPPAAGGGGGGVGYADAD